MKIKTYKVFKKNCNKSNFIEIELKYFDQNVDYFDFLGKNYELGKQQIILNAQFMISLIEYFVRVKKYSMASINFFEEAIVPVDEIDCKRKLMNDKKESVFDFIKFFELFKNTDNIEILKIVFDNDEIDSTVTCNANGLIEIDEKNSVDILSDLKQYLESIINE